MRLSLMGRQVTTEGSPGCSRNLANTGPANARQPRQPGRAASRVCRSCYLFAAGDGDIPVHYRIDAGPLTLVAFDCTVPHHSGGRVDPDSLPWLGAALAADPERPTLLMLHHPPFHTGIGHMDQQGLENAALLEAVAPGSMSLRRVVSANGHAGDAIKKHLPIDDTCIASLSLPQ